MKKGRILQVIMSLLPSSRSWKAVLLSIVAATTFWVFNSLNQSYTTSINYPITFEFPHEDYVIIEELPDKVQINVSGGGWSIFRKTFVFSLPAVPISLKQPADVKKIAGSGLRPIISEQLDELRVNYVITDTLHINIERKKSKKVVVVVDSATIALEPNFRITSKVNTFPDSVTVVGPESIINQLPDGLPMAIEENEIDENFDEFVEFKIRGYNQPLLQIDPAEINVQFSVEEFVTFTTKVPLLVINLPDNALIADSLVDVAILMKKSERNNLIQDSIIVEANFENIKEDSTILPQVIRYPPQLTSVTADTVSVKVSYD